jgi:hypothetical protein
VVFHVEIRRSLHRARAFNLSEERLRRTVIEPWRQGGPVELGDQTWDPEESTLRILEGPELSPPDLALGRGWNSAERSAADVTSRALHEAAADAVVVAVLADTPAGHEAAMRILNELGTRTADWAEVRARMPAEVVALLVVERGTPTGAWLFEAGFALGALDRRVVVAQLGDDPPPGQLHNLGAIRLEPQALLERLRTLRT